MATAPFTMIPPTTLSADSQALAFSVVANLAASTPAAAAAFSDKITHSTGAVGVASNDGKIQRFVQKLWQIVNSKSDLVGWSPDGSSVVVYKTKEFAKQVLPHYFNTSNMSSFTRQLHFYGFKKTNLNKRRSENWECKHEYFVRNHPEWLVRITRKRCNVQMASQEETIQLRKELNELREVVAQQQKQMQSMAAMLLALQPRATHGTDRKRKAGYQFARVNQAPHTLQSVADSSFPSLPVPVNPDQNQFHDDHPEKMQLQLEDDGLQAKLEGLNDLTDANMLIIDDFNYWS